MEDDTVVSDREQVDASESQDAYESENQEVNAPPIDEAVGPAAVKPAASKRKPTGARKAAASKAKAPAPRTARNPVDNPEPARNSPQATRAARSPVKAPAPKSIPRPTSARTPARNTAPAGPDYREPADLLKLISDATRMQIVDLLRQGSLNVTELCERLGHRTQPAVSHHLALLRHGRVIEPSRDGKHNYYSLTSGYGNILARVVAGLVAA